MVSRYVFSFYYELLSKILVGEHNAGGNRDKYNCTFPKMIEAWRNIWHTRTNSSTDLTFPFGFVQVSSLSTKLFLYCHCSYRQPRMIPE